MTYEEFENYMAHYGFTSCPITEDQFEQARLTGANLTTLYAIACDVNAGFDFDYALAINTEVYSEN